MTKKNKTRSVDKKAKTRTVELVCPKCKEKFARMRFEYGAQVDPEDITVLKGDKVFKKNDPLACTACGYPYMSWDIYIAIAEAQENEKKA